MAASKHCANCGHCSADESRCAHPSNGRQSEKVVSRYVAYRSRPWDCPGWKQVPNLPWEDKDDEVRKLLDVCLDASTEDGQ